MMPNAIGDERTSNIIESQLKKNRLICEQRQTYTARLHFLVERQWKWW